MFALKRCSMATVKNFEELDNMENVQGIDKVKSDFRNCREFALEIVLRAWISIITNSGRVLQK